MRIVLLNDDNLPTARGGAAVIVENLRQALTERGHEVTLITTHQNEDRGKLERHNGTVSIFVNYPLPKRHRMCLGYPAMREMLTQLFSELRPDIVHAHNIHTYLTYESLLLAHNFTERIFLTAHDTFLVSFGRVRGPRYERSVIEGTPFRLTIADHVRAAGRAYWPLRNRRIREVLQASGTQVIAISNATANLLAAHGIQSQVIRNGIAQHPTPSDMALKEFRERHSITGPIVLFSGRVRADKGISCLRTAMERVREEIPAAQLLISGDACDADPKEGVVCTGWLDRNQNAVSFFAADIVAVPSIYLDNFPTVNLEAGTAGKPVVGTIFGGTPEVIQQGKTGILVNPRNTAAFAAAITTLLRDPARRMAMGIAGKARIEAEFSLQKQVDAYSSLYTGQP